MIAVGSTLVEAFNLAVEVETLAAMYWRALQIGDPMILSDDEMATVLAKFEDYSSGSAKAGKGTRKTRP